jgi:hypothetical protein
MFTFYKFLTYFKNISRLHQIYVSFLCQFNILYLVLTESLRHKNPDDGLNNPNHVASLSSNINYVLLCTEHMCDW